MSLHEMLCRLPEHAQYIKEFEGVEFNYEDDRSHDGHLFYSPINAIGHPAFYALSTTHGEIHVAIAEDGFVPHKIRRSEKEEIVWERLQDTMSSAGYSMEDLWFMNWRLIPYAIIKADDSVTTLIEKE